MFKAGNLRMDGRLFSSKHVSWYFLARVLTINNNLKLNLPIPLRARIGKDLRTSQAPAATFPLQEDEFMSWFYRLNGQVITRGLSRRILSVYTVLCAKLSNSKHSRFTGIIALPSLPLPAHHLGSGSLFPLSILTTGLRLQFHHDPAPGQKRSNPLLQSRDLVLVLLTCHPCHPA
jgi:hypothetical protein